MPSKLHFLSKTSKDDIVRELKREGIHDAHFINGVYSAPAELIVPTTLAGFQYIADYVAIPDQAFVIAVNSNVSMEKILSAKRASDEEKAKMQGMFARADKVCTPLALEHPDRPVVVMFYDEETPTALYNYLAISGMRMRSLHKWGYGTNPQAPKIEGAHNFDRVLAFPLLNDIKPVCHDLTAAEDQSSLIDVKKLQDEQGLHGASYITVDGGLLFPLHHESLQKYAAKRPSAAPDSAPALNR